MHCALPSVLRLPLVGLALVFALVLAACGGSPPPPAIPAPAPTAPPTSATPPEEAPRASVVHFDDLGVSFAVPPGYRVLGDDELAARIRASADPRLRDVLRDRAKQKMGLPLLSLAKQEGGLSVTLTVVVVPKDATPTELLDQQRTVMAEHLEGFEVVQSARMHEVDGVPGVELGDRYVVRAGGETKRMASTLRVYVRGGLATLVSAVWPAQDESLALEAQAVLAGIHFQEPQP